MTRGFGSLAPLLLILATAAALFAILLLVAGQATLAIAPALLVVIMLAAGAVDSASARRKLARHGGSVRRVDSDARDDVPTLASDADAPVGATDEGHDELGPHDVPPGHPSREAVERASAARPH